MKNDTTTRTTLTWIGPAFTAPGEPAGWYLTPQYIEDGLWVDESGDLLAAGDYAIGDDDSEAAEATARRIAAERTGLSFDGDPETDPMGIVRILGEGR